MAEIKFIFSQVFGFNVTKTKGESKEKLLSQQGLTL